MVHQTSGVYHAEEDVSNYSGVYEDDQNSLARFIYFDEYFSVRSAMVRSIKVFVKKIWIVKPFSTRSRGLLWGGWAPQNELETAMSWDDEEALRIAKELSEELKARLTVKDIESVTGRISAFVNKVKVTPTIIINGHRFTGVPNKHKLLQIIESGM